MSKVSDELSCIWAKAIHHPHQWLWGPVITCFPSFTLLMASFDQTVLCCLTVGRSLSSFLFSESLAIASIFKCNSEHTAVSDCITVYNTVTFQADSDWLQNWTMSNLLLALSVRLNSVQSLFTRLPQMNYNNYNVKDSESHLCCQSLVRGAHWWLKAVYAYTAKHKIQTSFFPLCFFVCVHVACSIGMYYLEFYHVIYVYFVFFVIIRAVKWLKNNQINDTLWLINLN